MACDHILLSALVSCIMKDKLVLGCKFIFCGNILKFDGRMIASTIFKLFPGL